MTKRFCDHCMKEIDGKFRKLLISDSSFRPEPTGMSSEICESCVTKLTKFLKSLASS